MYIVRRDASRLHRTGITTSSCSIVITSWPTQPDPPIITIAGWKTFLLFTLIAFTTNAASQVSLSHVAVLWLCIPAATVPRLCYLHCRAGQQCRPAIGRSLPPTCRGSVLYCGGQVQWWAATCATAAERGVITAARPSPPPPHTGVSSCDSCP